MDIATLVAVLFDGHPLPPSRLRPVVVGRPSPIRLLKRFGAPLVQLASGKRGEGSTHKTKGNQNNPPIIKTG